MIKCEHLKLDGVLLFEFEKHEDSRGSFSEVYREGHYAKFLPNNSHFIQDNESFSKKGVLRGLHFQTTPLEQSKLIRVSHGEIQDVIVDIRKDSKTFGKHLSLKLSKQNGKQLFVPKGFAHGFLVLSETAIVNYKVDSYYSKDHDSGILFNDSDLGIKWEFHKTDIKASDKDLNLPRLKNLNIL
jgi:dTDP-4-dehydrorhamnose 3,5-epimerase